MSSAGHVLDSIARMKFNRNQLMARRQRIADLKSHYIDSIKIEGYEYKEDNIPIEVVERVRADIRIRMRRKRIRSTVLSIVFTILTIVILVLLVSKFIEI